MEEMEIVLEGNGEGDGCSRFMVIGKIIAGKILYRRGVLNILRNIWALEVAPMIREVGENMYSICFVNEIQMKRAIDEGPWSIMGHCLVLKEWEEGAVLREIQFTEICFWVQVHNVPLDLLTKANAELIGRKLGRVVEVEDPSGNEGFGRGFLRMRLGVEIGKALVERFWIPRKNKGRIWAMIKYEKLSDFCFSCEKLGHVAKGCVEEARRSVV